MLCAVMMARCATLKRPVLRIRSAMITGKIARMRRRADAVELLHAAQPDRGVRERIQRTADRVCATMLGQQANREIGPEAVADVGEEDIGRIERRGWRGPGTAP